MQRREFIKMAAVAPLVGKVGTVGAQGAVTFEEFLRESAVSREVINRFLRGPSWARFDPEVGYVLGNYLPSDGIDGSATISTIQANGARASHMYTGKRCRINTYGNSFTHCHQVSDGETWQEYLAAHLGEPVRNFGMGGFGVYQAYRRMLKEERSDHGAEYVMLYIWATITSAPCCAAAMRSPTDFGTTRAGACSTATSGRTWRWISTPDV